MQKICPKYSSARKGPQPFVQSVTVRPVGPGYCRPFSSRQQEIRDISWLAQITSPNGSKPSHWPTSKMWILRNSFGETLLHDSGSLVPLFQIMDSNLKAKPSEDTVANWGSLTSTQLQLILKKMDRPRLLTRS